MRIILGITGASGQVYAQSLLSVTSGMPEIDWEIVFTENGLKVWRFEIGDDIPAAYQIYSNDNLFSLPASGSACFDAMIICPCSMGTLGKIASGVTDNLVTRAADVMLKESRKLILVIRESPLNLIHINNMKKLTMAGAIIMPASPGFYFKPSNLTTLIDDFSKRILKTAGVNINHREWESPNAEY